MAEAQCLYGVGRIFTTSSARLTFTGKQRGGDKMKASVLQENLLAALSTAQKVVPSRNRFPILENVLIKDEGGRLVIGATDLGTTIS